MAHVIIGMDPHKRSATIEIINDREKVLAQGRFGTDTAGYPSRLRVFAAHVVGRKARHQRGYEEEAEAGAGRRKLATSDGMPCCRTQHPW